VVGDTFSVGAKIEYRVT